MMSNDDITKKIKTVKVTTQRVNEEGTIFLLESRESFGHYYMRYD